MSKIAVIYNTCGLSHEQVEYYKAAINNILAQNMDGVRVVLSACMNKESTIEEMKREFGSEISYSIIREVVPISVSFNKSVQECVKAFGEFEGYCYLDSGMLMNEGSLQKIYDVFKSGNYGIVSTRVDNDSGYHLWFGVGSHHTDCSQDHLLFDENWINFNGYRLDRNGNFIIPVGKCCNLHINLFSNLLYKEFNNKILPDVFAAYCLESVQVYQAAAIRQNWVITKDVMCHHQAAMDGACLGYAKMHDLVYRIPKPMMELVKPGIPYGIGYDESRFVVMHNPECFDENYYCKNDELKQYINDYLFLPKEYLDYDKINCEFIV